MKLLQPMSMMGSSFLQASSESGATLYGAETEARQPSTLYFLGILFHIGLARTDPSTTASALHFLPIQSR
jgi:hypothetical protein